MFACLLCFLFIQLFWGTAVRWMLTEWCFHHVAAGKEQSVFSSLFYMRTKRACLFWSPSVSSTQLSILVFLSIFVQIFLSHRAYFFYSGHRIVIPVLYLDSQSHFLASVNFNTSLASVEPLITSWGTLISFRYGFLKKHFCIIHFVT